MSNSNIVPNLAIDIFPSANEVIDGNQEIADSLRRFWQHESLGLNGDENLTRDCTGKGSVKMVNQRYQVSLPWKKNIVEPLSSDYLMCKQRLESLFICLKMKPDVLRQYDDIFCEQLSDGIIEKVQHEELNTE